MKNFKTLLAAGVFSLLSTPLMAQETAGTIPTNVTFTEYCTVTNSPLIDFADAAPSQIAIQSVNVQMECAVASDTTDVILWIAPVHNIGDAVVFTRAGVDATNTANWMHGYDEFSFRATDAKGPQAFSFSPSSGTNQYSFNFDATLLNTESTPTNLSAPFYNENFAGAATVYIEFVTF